MHIVVILLALSAFAVAQDLNCKCTKLQGDEYLCKCVAVPGSAVGSAGPRVVGVESAKTPPSATPVVATTPQPPAARSTPTDGASTGTTATGLPIYTGPRGGQYHISPKSGKKVYERRK